MTNYDRIHLKCKRGHEFQVACVGIPADSPDDGYIPVTSDEEAAQCSEVVWGVYLRDPDDGRFLHLEDHPTREAAMAAAQGEILALNQITEYLQRRCSHD